MRILGHFHKYPPEHNAGAEWYAHSVLTWLAERGHAVAVATTMGPQPFEFDGVRIVPRRQTLQEYRRSDVILTHLDATRRAIRAARVAGRPLVHLLHNDKQLRFWNVEQADCALAVCNSEWVRKMARWEGPAIVLPPPVFRERYEVQGGSRDCLTLVNLTEAKGAEQFYELAQRLPDRRFLGVVGAYGAQIIPDLSERPPNVELIPNTPDARGFYRRTRLLLMPSSYESWGRVAVEAACSGIPTIAHPTPGLRESLGSAGLFLKRDRLDRWVGLIEELDDPDHYAHWGAKALRRSLELDPQETLEKFEVELEAIIR